MKDHKSLSRREFTKLSIAAAAAVSSRKAFADEKTATLRLGGPVKAQNPDKWIHLDEDKLLLYHLFLCLHYMFLLAFHMTYILRFYKKSLPCHFANANDHLEVFWFFL